jgi:hypothetical protein
LAAKILCFSGEKHMKSASTRRILLSFALTSVAVFVLAQPAPQDVLGKVGFAALYDAAPAMPASTAQAHANTYGTGPNANADTSSLDTFYAPYRKRLEEAQKIIQPALDAMPAHEEAIQQRTIADANASPLISRMGGVDKMSEMSEEEIQQAAAQAVGSYQQSLSGGSTPPGGGMQVMMQRMMNDPAYQARFEKMSKKEQEAEIAKYTGSDKAPPPPTVPTAAERQAQRASDEMKTSIDRQSELGTILESIANANAEFVTKDKEITNSAGNHEEIRKQYSSRIDKIPMVEAGEAGMVRDPVQYKAARRAWAAADRQRASAELRQRTVLYGQRKTRYRELAASYSTWLRQHVAATTRTAQNLDESIADVALRCEKELIQLGENLRQYNEDVTREVAAHERSYQTTMAE